MKPFAIILAAVFFSGCLSVATTETSHLQQLIQGQNSATAHRPGVTMTRPERVAVQLDDIIKERDAIATGNLSLDESTRTASKQSYQPTDSPNVEQYMKEMRGPLDLQASSSIRVGNDPDYYVQLQNQMEPLENDYKLILENFKKIGCFQNQDKPIGIENLILDPAKGQLQNNTLESNPYSLCDGDLADMLFMPLGDVNSHGGDLFNHFNSHVYQPLSYKVFPNRFSFADSLQDLLNLDKDNLMIHKNMPIPDFNRFKQIILGGFAEIANYAADFDANKPLISKIILDILKHFHIYWNVKRQNNEIDSTKINTYTIIKSIIGRYREQNAAMKATTVHILNSIRDAYFRFIRAHKMLGLLQGNSIDVVAFAALRRYDSFIQCILKGQFNRDVYVYELSVQLEFLTYIVGTLVSGMKPEDIFQVFQEKVYLKIIDMYNVYAKWMLETNNEHFDRVTEVTATTLLKLKHRQSILYSQVDLQAWGFVAAFSWRSHTYSYIKFIYEIFDYWLLIPTSCQNYQRLDRCMIGNAHEALIRLKFRTNIHTAVAGVNLLRYLFNTVDQILDTMTAQNAFSHFESFRNLFFAELFKSFENTKLVYQIKDMTLLDRLQNQIGKQVERLKASPELSKEMTNLLDVFDDKLYDFFLDQKDIYNPYGKMGRNPNVLTEITINLENLMNDFLSDHPETTDVISKGLFKNILLTVKLWEEALSRDYMEGIKDKGSLTPGTQFTALPPRDSVTIENIIKEPVANSLASTPMFIQGSVSGKRLLKNVL